MAEAFSAVGFMVHESAGALLLARVHDKDAQCDIDRVEVQGGRLRFLGYAEHIARPAKRMIDELAWEDGVVDLSWHKTTLGTANLKELALKAGFGARGRNGLVVSKQHGARLRFGLVLKAPLQSALEHFASFATTPDIAEQCSGCHACIDTCPRSMTLEGNGWGADPERCIARVVSGSWGECPDCNACAMVCP